VLLKKSLDKEFSVMTSLWPLLRLYPWAIPTIVVLGVLSSLAEGLGISLFIPLLQSLEGGEQASSNGNWLVQSLDGLFARIPAEQRLSVISLAIFMSVLLKAVLAFGNSVLFKWLDARVSHRLRSSLFRQLLNVSYGYFQRRDSGKLLNTLSNETWRTSQALSVLVGMIITTCTLVVYSLLLLLISWQLTLLVGVAMTGIALVVRLLTRHVARLGQEATEANAVLSSRMLEGIWAMKIIRAFGREPFEQQRFDGASQRVSRTFYRLGIVGGAVSPVYEILAAALLVGIMLLTLQNPSNLAMFLVFLVLLYRLQPKIKALDSARVSLASLKAGVDEVNNLLAEHDKPYTRSGDQPHMRLEQAVVFDRVSFRYGPDEKPALEDVTITVPAGKTTAFVGPSGAGKSTIINLLLRFYDPTSGTVRVDGVPLQDLNLRDWRHGVALVSQDIFIFGETVRDNIAYGQPGASLEEVVRAAKLAHAHEFIIGLPQGYDTPLGDRGVRLSGGQQQRITLARAILRDPQILILDEATNALDSISEFLIQEALDTLSHGRTVIVIAHRLSTIERADHIVVLEGGRVSEQGSFEQLRAQDGLFTRLYNVQNRRMLS
jgi:subfamily B ATP-binding cassette protein MsbA